jgi:hypothetical protein
MNAAESDRLEAATALLMDCLQALGDSDDRMTRAVIALVECAHAGATAALTRDQHAATEAVACARGAVVTATCLTRWIADGSRSGTAVQPPASLLELVEVPTNVVWNDDVRI